MLPLCLANCVLTQEVGKTLQDLELIHSLAGLLLQLSAAPEGANLHRRESLSMTSYKFAGQGPGRRGGQQDPPPAQRRDQWSPVNPCDF